MLSEEQLRAIHRATGTLPPGYENHWRVLQWAPQETGLQQQEKKRRGRGIFGIGEAGHAEATRLPLSGGKNETPLVTRNTKKRTKRSNARTLRATWPSQTESERTTSDTAGHGR